MGKVLLIEPYRTLRQAISLALFPDHEVHVEENLSAPGAGPLKDYDLLIVDGSALRELNQLTSEVTRAIQNSKIPTLWLEEDDSSRPFSRDRFLVIKKPIERDAFQSALNEFFSPPSSPKRRTATPSASRSKAGPPKETEQKAGEGAEQTAFQFIDLVDVVEEQPRSGQGKKAVRRSK